MHVLKRKYKVLAPQYWMSGNIFERDAEAGFYTPCFCIFNRPGIYYDRVYKYAWFETGDGRAFLYDNKMFFYELNLFRVWQKYNTRQYEALKHVVAEHVATRQQREDCIAYEQYRYSNDIRRGAWRYRNRCT